jgi:hypothetical protein
MICSINPHMQIRKTPARKGNLLLDGIALRLNQVINLRGQMSANDPIADIPLESVWVRRCPAANIYPAVVVSSQASREIIPTEFVASKPCQFAGMVEQRERSLNVRFGPLSDIPGFSINCPLLGKAEIT